MQSADRQTERNPRKFPFDTSLTRAEKQPDAPANQLHAENIPGNKGTLMVAVEGQVERSAKPANRTNNITCTVCACLCDDLRVTMNKEKIESISPGCSLADPWFRRLNRTELPGRPLLRGSPIEPRLAVEQAADWLRRAKAPLIYGLSRTSTDGQRSAVRLADQIGATIDTTASLGHGPSIMAIQDVGESTCTLGEAKNRGDLILFWGANPAVTHPRHFERYSGDCLGEFLPRGRADRYIVALDVEPTETAAYADQFICIPRQRDFEVLVTLRQLIRGQAPRADADTGVDRRTLLELSERMKSCRYGVVFFGFGLSRSHLGSRTVAALLKLVADLNHHTAFCARRLRGSGDVTGADTVLAWQTGFPFSVNLGRGYPRYNPGEFTALNMLERREVDLCLLVGSHGVRRFSESAREWLGQIPTIVLDTPTAEIPLAPTLYFPTAIHGVHAPGVAYRMDEVPIPLPAFLPRSLPTDTEVLEQIRERL